MSFQTFRRGLFSRFLVKLNGNSKHFLREPFNSYIQIPRENEQHLETFPVRVNLSTLV